LKGGVQDFERWSTCVFLNMYTHALTHTHNTHTLTHTLTHIHTHTHTRTHVHTHTRTHTHTHTHTHAHCAGVIVSGTKTARAAGESERRLMGLEAGGRRTSASKKRMSFGLS